MHGTTIKKINKQYFFVIYIFHWFSHYIKGLESPGLKSRKGKRRFSVLQNVETGFEAHPASFPIGRGSFPVDKSGRP
jgi:hypothetical protein